jgi:acyl-CoA reductase-like NAD-dependent aldehyde dehydrogenase
MPCSRRPSETAATSDALIWADWQSCGDGGAELLDPVLAQYKECFAVVRCSYGGRVSSAATFTDISPIDEQPIAEVARGGPAEVAAAVAAAGAAFPGWAAAGPDERASVLRAIAAGIDRRAEELAQAETRDNGSLLRSHRRSVMPRAAQNFRFFVGWLGCDVKNTVCAPEGWRPSG